MAYQTPRTWTTAELVTAAMLNQDIRDNVSFLANPPACRVYHNAAQSITDAAEITVAFNSERFDTAAMHDTVTNNSRITIPVAGLYIVTFNGEIAAAADYTLLTVRFVVNNATNIARSAIGTVANATQTPGLHLSTLYKFAAADYVDVRVLQDNSASAARNLLSTSAMSPEFSACMVGLG